MARMINLVRCASSFVIFYGKIFFLAIQIFLLILLDNIIQRFNSLFKTNWSNPPHKTQYMQPIVQPKISLTVDIKPIDSKEFTYYQEK